MDDALMALVLTKGRSQTRTPAVISGSSLVLWLRGDLGITIGTGVSQWSDQSGTGNHVTQVTGSQQPTLVTGGQDGRSLVRFAKASTQLLSRLGSFAGVGAADYPRIYIVQKVNTGAGNMSAYDLEPSTSIDQGHSFTLAGGSFFHDSVNSAQGWRAGGSAAFATTKLHDVNPSAGGQTVLVNNAAYAVGANTMGTFAGAKTRLIVGAKITSAVPFDGDIYEMLIVNPTPSAGQHAALVAYFKARYPTMGIA